MTITPEIEAVARAIYEKRNGLGAVPFSRRPIAHKEPYYLDAVAAIRALREPTWRMQIEGRNALLLETEDDEYSPSTNETRDAYTAMIDVALGGNK
jgi:hypothetical protein